MSRLWREHRIRQRAAAKRGGSRQLVTLDEELCPAAISEVGGIDLDEALTRLARLDERMARIVELRIFAGMAAREVAHVVGVTRQMVQNDWRVARMWLNRELIGRET